MSNIDFFYFLCGLRDLGGWYLFDKSVCFMQNEPNLPDDEMNVKSKETRDYEKISAFCLLKNEPKRTQNEPNPKTDDGGLMTEDGLSFAFPWTENGFEITFYPGPVENQMHNHQNDEQSSQIKVDVAPFVPGHREQRLNLAESPATGKFPAASTRAGRQYELDYKAGESQTEQTKKANRIDDKIQRYAFHCMSTFIKKRNNMNHRAKTIIERILLHVKVKSCSKADDKSV